MGWSTPQSVPVGLDVSGAHNASAWSRAVAGKGTRYTSVWLDFDAAGRGAKYYASISYCATDWCRTEANAQGSVPRGALKFNALKRTLTFRMASPCGPIDMTWRYKPVPKPEVDSHLGSRRPSIASYSSREATASGSACGSRLVDPGAYMASSRYMSLRVGRFDR